MLLSVGIQPTSLRPDGRSGDKWVVTTSQDPSDIPHYIVTPKQKDGRKTKILVTIPRRWTECEHCRSTNHRSHKCPNKGKKRITPQIDLTKQQDFPPEFFDLSSKPRSNGWVHQKGRKKPVKVSTKTAVTNSINLSNRFLVRGFSGQDTDNLDTTVDTVGDDEDWPSFTSTPRSTSSSHPTLFRQLPPGTFDFQTGNIKAPPVAAKNKQKKKPPPAKRTPRTRGASQGDAAKPATPKRPLRPRKPTSTTTQPEQLGEQTIDNEKATVEVAAKRTKLDPPNQGAISVNTMEKKPVSECSSGKAIPDNGPEPSGGGAGVEGVVPSSMPEADAALGAVGGIPHDPPLTCSLFDEGDGDADREKPPDENSQNESEMKTVNDCQSLL